jgi:biotin operon repressor
MVSKKDTNSSKQDFSEVLRGRTLQVYYLLLSTRQPWSGREIYRKLGFSSASLSFYHLDKLKEVGLVDVNEDGMYIATKRVRAGILAYFIDFGHRLIPRFLFYAFFFISFLISSFFFLHLTTNPSDIALVLVLVIVSLIFLFETRWLLQRGFQ